MTARTEDRIAALGALGEEQVARVALAAAARAHVGPREPVAPARRRAPSHARIAVVAAVVAAIAGAFAFALRPWGGESADAALLRRVALAVTPPPHTVQHVVMVLHQGSLVLTTESWESVDDPFTLRWRQIASNQCGGNWTTEFSSTLHQMQWFDADHDRVLRMPLVPAKERAAVPPGGRRGEFDPTVSFALALRRGDAHVAGTTTLGGTPVTQISWPADQANDPASRNLLYVATATGVPVAYQWGGGRLDATGGVVAQQTYPEYEFLPESTSSLDALSVSASHPEAAVPPVTTEKQFTAGYQEAQRLHCGGVG